MSTKLKVVLDRSGSMATVGPDTVDKYNEYVNKLVMEKGKEKIVLSLYQFDDEYLVIYEDVPVQDVEPLVYGDTYRPRGMTALLDAVGRTMDGDKSKLKKKDKGICVIVTDGMENASTDYTKEQITKLIQRLEDETAWTFVFLGANQDAFSNAQTFGIRNQQNVMSYGNTEEGQDVAFASLATATLSRSAMEATKGMSMSTPYFTPEQQDDAEKTMVDDSHKTKKLPKAKV